MTEIPDGWHRAKLGSLATMRSGGTPPTSDRSMFGGGIPWVSIKDMTRSGRYLHNTEETLSEKGLSDSNAVLFDAGTVLFAMYASVGEASIASIPVSSSQAILGINGGPALLNEYLYYMLLHARGRFTSLVQTGTQANLNKGLVEGFEVVVPDDVDEQERIASALGDVDRRIDALDILISKKTEIMGAVEHALVTGERRLPGFNSAWKPHLVSDLGTLRRGSGISKQEVAGSGVPCLRYGEIYTQYESVADSLLSRTSLESAARAARLHTGDVVFAGSGETREEIGKALAYVGAEPAYVGGDTIVLTPQGHDSAFLGYVLNSRPVIEQKSRLGQGDAVVHLYPSGLGTISVALPDLAEQRAISTYLSLFREEIRALSLLRAKELDIKNGLAHELLTGRTRLT